MNKDLIDMEIGEWLKQNQKRPNHSERIKFYKNSKYLRIPFQIFENYFKLFWLDIKNYPLKK